MKEGFPPVVRDDVEIRDLATDAVWRAAAQAIALRHALPAEPCESFATGSDVVWRAGDAVIKLTLPRYQDEIDTERRSLEHVQGRLSVRTPEVLAHGELEEWPYVVMSFVPGRSVAEVWPSLDRPARRRLARRLGESTRELHELPVPDQPEDRWPAFWSRCREAAPGNHRARVADRPDLLEQLDGFLRRAGPLDDRGRVFLHTELLEHHVFVQERDGVWSPSALIDFADAMVGPPAYDFAAPVEFIFRGERGLLGEFLAGYGDPGLGGGPERSRTLLAWALQHRFGSLARMLSLVEDRPPATLEALAEALYSDRD